MTRHTAESLAEVGSRSRASAIAPSGASAAPKTRRTAICRRRRSNWRAADGKILADKVRDKLEITAAITGLDFGRFTKSMMLSQGQFAAFLNADANDRAELLEELTGTEIYGRLSEQVFESHKQAKTDLDALHQRASGIELLNDEQRHSLTERLTALSAQESALGKQTQQQQQALSWLQQWQRLQQQQNEGQRRLETALREQAEAAPQLQRLALSEPAENCGRCARTRSLPRRAADDTTAGSPADAATGAALGAAGAAAAGGGKGPSGAASPCRAYAATATADR